jgi:hypothetical protein
MSSAILILLCDCDFFEFSCSDGLVRVLTMLLTRARPRKRSAAASLAV